MLGYILGRLVGLIGVILVVSFVSFGMLYRLPGGPFDESKQPLSAEALANVRAKYNLDKPFYVVWASYMANAARGDFGTSYQAEGKPIVEIFREQWGTSLQLGLLALAWSIPLGIGLGILSATRRNSATDYVLRFTSIFGTTIPNFALAVFGVYLFSVVLKVLPTGGWDPTGDFRTVIMPVVIFGLLPFGIIMRYTRNGMVETLSQDYVRTAHAKGLSSHSILVGHTLRNVLIPIITVLAALIPNALTGSAIIEKSFRINGIGKYFVDSVGTRDYPMVMATVIIIAALWGLFYLAADILYTFADPRIRLNKR